MPKDINMTATLPLETSREARSAEGHDTGETHRASALGKNNPETTSRAQPSSRPFPVGGGHGTCETHSPFAPADEICDADPLMETNTPTRRNAGAKGSLRPQVQTPRQQIPAAGGSAKTDDVARQEGEPEEGGQKPAVDQPSGAPDLRFTDPLIAEIVETWRLRQDMVRAQTKLTLQIKSICRRFTAGDKAEADKLFASMQSSMAHEKAEACFIACLPLMEAKKPIEAARKAQEKHLTKLGAKLPIAHMADDIRGIGHLALAKIAGECGDLSAYRSVSAVWKRAGLAVINGGRQRKVTGDAALEHGYSPERRSTFWNIATAMIKAQGKGDDAGPYRQFYDVEKEKQLAKDLTPGHAHNRAMRHMTKEVLKDIVVEWRNVSVSS